MNEGGLKQPLQDELEGQDHKTSEGEGEESSGGERGGGGAEGGEERSGDGGGEGGAVVVASSKRRHVHSQRMQEYLQQQDEAVQRQQKQRRCQHPGCQKVFSSAPGLRYHQRSHQPDLSNFSCQKCRKEFKSLNGLKYHLQKTKCQDTPVDVLPSSPPHPPPQLPPPLSSPPAAESEEDDRSHLMPSSGHLLLPAPTKNDETDSMWEQEMEWQNWPEPRHRKMESRRKKMEQVAQQKTAAEAEQRVASVTPVSRQHLPLERSSQSNEAGPLFEFATIATGPQSPLLSSAVGMDWEQARLQKVESESARGGVGPRAVWQCFMQGSRVSIGGEDSSPWHAVEDVAASCLHQHGPFLPDDLSQPVPVRLLSQRRSSEREDEVELAFECESCQQSRLTACCVSCHPFFVRNKGWASCDSSRTREIYDLPTSGLETGDICLPPSCTQQTSSGKHSDGTEVNSMEYSSVVALSEMAQKRNQEGSGAQQQTAPISPGDQHAPKAKRPMNAFLLWSQTKRPEYITKFPRTNNREISTMLSKEWRCLSQSEKKQLQNKAKVKAELQKQQYPDCWKRKPHH